MVEAVLPGSIKAFGADDIVLPFHVAPLDTRGRAIRLGPVLDVILARHAYPAAVEKLLAEAIALTALIYPVELRGQSGPNSVYHYKSMTYTSLN